MEITNSDFRNAVNHDVIRACMDIKKHIWINEESYHMIFWGSFEDTRWYYIFWVVDDILRASMSLIENFDQIKDKKPLKDEWDWISRIVFEYIYSQQKYRSRKLFESLVELIIFSQNNQQYSFKLHILLASLKDKLSKKGDLRDFYGCSNNNIQYQIDHDIERINSVTSENWVTSFKFSSLTFPLLKEPSIGNIERSVRSLFKDALKFADTREKVLLWDSYNSFYWDMSQFVHSWQEAIEFIDYDVIEKEISYIWLMNINILIRVKNLLGLSIESIDRLELFLNSDKSNAGKSFASLTDKPYSVWDLVFVFDDLVEITEVIKSNFWYTSFKVKYLWKMPIQWIEEDFFPSRFFQGRILNKNNPRLLLEHVLSTQINKEVKFSDVYREILKDETITDDKLYEAFKNVFIDLNNAGILIQMYQKTTE